MIKTIVGDYRPAPISSGDMSPGQLYTSDVHEGVFVRLAVGAHDYRIFHFIGGNAAPSVMTGVSLTVRPAKPGSKVVIEQE